MVDGSAVSGAEESRSYLQQRLERLSQVLFCCFAAFLLFMWAMYRIEPQLTPAYSDVTFATNALGVAIVAVIWRVLSRDRNVSRKTLDTIDAVYAGGVGVFLAFNGYFGTDLLFAPFTCLLFACLVVLTRAIIVPSTARRTALLSSLTLVPMVVTAVAMAAQDWPHAPPIALVATVVSICVLVVLLATVGSKTTYGLRQDVRAAREHRQLGPYTLGRRISFGGMGEVYEAQHRLLRRPTAIKLVLPAKVGADTLDRFEREVQATSQLTHANTIAVFDYGRSEDGVFYYAMEYLDGIDLERLVQRYGAQPHARVLAILSQVAGALHEAHTKNFVHRDVKPGNIMLCERGTVPDVAKVLDFGLVKEIAQDTEHTQKMHIVGTPGYIAPEIVSGSPVSPSADIYSLGAVAYLLLTGRRPFEGNNAIDVCVQHVTKPVPALDRVPPALARLVERCLAKAPEARPTALALSEELRQIQASDWSETQARDWWVEFHAKRTSGPVDVPTQTITVDIAHRDAVLSTMRAQP